MANYNVKIIYEENYLAKGETEEEAKQNALDLFAKQIFCGGIEPEKVVMEKRG